MLRRPEAQPVTALAPEAKKSDQIGQITYRDITGAGDLIRFSINRTRGNGSILASNNRQIPNVLFILSDDQGEWAMGCSGNDELPTPNLDRIAATGIRFENFFCASPVCSPARASILTGQLPSQHGVQDFLSGGNSRHIEGDGEEIEYLRGRKSYIEVLAENGYACGLSGKWHMGHSSLPQLGFDYWHVHASGGGDYYQAPMLLDGNFYKSDEYVTDLITDNAIEYLDGQLESSEPFSLNVHYTSPHAPWGRRHHPPEVFNEFYENCAFDSVPCEPVHPNQLHKAETSGPPGDTPENRRLTLSGYFAAVAEMDRNIGRLLDWLEEKDLRGNTLVLFNADNGMNMGHHGIWGKGNGTYPPNMFDTAVKVPALISRPGHIPQDLVSDKLLSQYDFAPTILGYLGLSMDSARPLPGRDFSPILRGESIASDAPIYVLDEYGPTRMIRTHSWKYVHRYPDGPTELYNLINDPLERENLADQSGQEGRISKMKAELEEWYGRYVDPRMDGLNSKVMGRGQMGLVASPDYEKPFADDVVYFRDR